MATPQAVPLYQGTSSYRKLLLEERIADQIAYKDADGVYTPEVLKKTWEVGGYVCTAIPGQDFIDLSRPKTRLWGGTVLSNPKITNGIREFGKECQVSEKVLFQKGSGVIVLQRRQKDLENSYKNLLKIAEEESDNFLTDRTTCGEVVKAIVPKGRKQVHELAIQSDDEVVIPTADDIRNMKIAWVTPTWNLPQRDACLKTLFYGGLYQEPFDENYEYLNSQGDNLLQCAPLKSTNVPNVPNVPPEDIYRKMEDDFKKANANRIPRPTLEDIRDKMQMSPREKYDQLFSVFTKELEFYQKMEAEVDIFQKNDKMLENVNKKHLELLNVSSNIKAENDKITIFKNEIQT